MNLSVSRRMLLTNSLAVTPISRAQTPPPPVQQKEMVVTDPFAIRALMLRQLYDEWRENVLPAVQARRLEIPAYRYGVQVLECYDTAVQLIDDPELQIVLKDIPNEKNRTYM